MAISSVERAYLLRAEGGSFSMRLNIVGTSWLCVTLYFGIRLRYCSGSKCSMTITVPPTPSARLTAAFGAEWYIGAGDR